MHSNSTALSPRLVIANGAEAVSPGGKRWRRWGLAFWAVFAIAIAGKAIIAPRSHTTFPTFVSGTTCWWAEQDPYDIRVCPHEFRYGPPFAVLFTPFAWLPREVGGPVWGLFNVGVFFWSLRVLMRRVLPIGWTSRREGLFLLLVGMTSARGLWASQTNTLIMAMLVGAAAAIVERRWWLAALLITVPVYIKVWPLAAALLLIACWPRPLAGRFGIACAGLGLAPFCVKNWSWVAQSYSAWFGALTGPVMQTRHIYRDFWTIWEQFVPVQPQAYLAVQLTTALLLLAGCLWIRRRAASERITLTLVLGLWAAWQLLFGPGTERNTISLIAPLTSWGLIAAHAERRRWGWMLTAFTLLTVFSFGLFERSVQNHFPAVVAALPVGVLAYLAWLMAYAWDVCRRTALAPVRLRIVVGEGDAGKPELPHAVADGSPPVRKAA